MCGGEWVWGGEWVCGGREVLATKCLYIFVQVPCNNLISFTLCQWKGWFLLFLFVSISIQTGSKFIFSSFMIFPIVWAIEEKSMLKNPVCISLKANYCITLKDKKKIIIIKSKVKNFLKNERFLKHLNFNWYWDEFPNKIKKKSGNNQISFILFNWFFIIIYFAFWSLSQKRKKKRKLNSELN